jgi:hypothetical protein
MAFSAKEGCVLSTQTASGKEPFSSKKKYNHDFSM